MFRRLGVVVIVGGGLLRRVLFLVAILKTPLAATSPTTAAAGPALLVRRLFHRALLGSRNLLRFDGFFSISGYACQDEMRRNEFVIGFDDDVHAVILLHFTHRGALVVHDVKRDARWYAYGNLARPAAQSFFFDGPQYPQRGRFRRRNITDTTASRALRRHRFQQARPQTLPGHFQQTEGADASDLDTGAVAPKRFLQLPFDRMVVAVLFHIDEVDDHQSGKVAQAKLAGDFLGSLKVCLMRGFFDMPFAGGPA